MRVPHLCSARVGKAGKDKHNKHIFQMSTELAGDGFVYVEQSLVPAGKAQSAPPARKKPRKYRGLNSKSHDGDRAPNPNKIHTDVTPGDYLQTINCTVLTDKEKTSLSYCESVEKDQ